MDVNLLNEAQSSTPTNGGLAAGTDLPQHASPTGVPGAPGRQRIGEILEDLGVVGAEQALLGRYEQDLGDERRLGAILVDQGMATLEQLDRALEIQAARRYSGETGVATGPDRNTSSEATPAASGRIRLARQVRSATMLLLAAVGAVTIADTAGREGAWHGVTAVVLLSVAFIGSAIDRRVTRPVPSRHDVALPCVDADPRAVRTGLDSHTTQVRWADEVWVAGDSGEPSCFAIAPDSLSGVPGLVVHQLDTKQEKKDGKRQARGGRAS